MGWGDVPCGKECEQLLAEHVIPEVIRLEQDGQDVDVVLALILHESFLILDQLGGASLDHPRGPLQCFVEIPR